MHRESQALPAGALVIANNTPLENIGSMKPEASPDPQDPRRDEAFVPVGEIRDDVQFS